MKNDRSKSEFQSATDPGGVEGGTCSMFTGESGVSAFALSDDTMSGLHSKQERLSQDLQEASDCINEAHNLLMKCKAAGNILDLNTAIYLLNSRDLQPDYLGPLSMGLLTRFIYTGELVDVISAAFSCIQAVAGLRKDSAMFSDADYTSEEDPQEILALGRSLQRTSNTPLWGSAVELSEALLLCYRLNGDLTQVDEQFPVWTRQLEEGVKVLQVIYDSSHKAMELAESAEDMVDISAAVTNFQQAIFLLPSGHHERSRVLSAVDLKDLDEAIKVYREVLPLQADPHSVVSVNALATALSIRFQQTENLPDINEAIDLQKDANSSDLDKAIELQREALGSCDPSHPERTRYLSNLASSLHARYHKDEDPADIDEAIKLNRRHWFFMTRRIQYLQNLGNTLCTRFDLSKDHQDIEEATNLHRETLVLCGQHHPDRRSCLICLGSTLEARFHRFQDAGALNEAIKLYRMYWILWMHLIQITVTVLQLASALRSRFKKEDMRILMTLMRQSNFTQKHWHSILHIIQEILQLLFEVEAAADSSSSMLIRAKAAKIWAEAIGLLPQIVASHGI
ncbi:hypothetical protein B0H13DRAFT_1926377 [Mycena leptocephala]|nr:hypothetical protein B0H13DRAFT_1926377 [Mycena leptocephala]